MFTNDSIYILYFAAATLFKQPERSIDDICLAATILIAKSCKPYDSNKRKLEFNIYLATRKVK